jgi:hypothetical protein
MSTVASAIEPSARVFEMNGWLIAVSPCSSSPLSGVNSRLCVFSTKIKLMP